MMRIKALGAAVLLTGLATSVAAETVWITETQPDFELALNGQTVVISRVPDVDARLPADYSLTSRACPPACIQPIQAARGVSTTGELEVLGFLKGPVALGRGLLIDARLPDTFGRGSIPGAVNVPTSTVAPENPYRPDIIAALGAVPGPRGTFDFSSALDLMIYADGPWDGTAVQMVRNLMDAGYPAEKLSYFRGGMQGWLGFGLTVSGRPGQG